MSPSELVKPRQIAAARPLIGLVVSLCALAGCTLLPGTTGEQAATVSAAVTATIPVGPGPILLAISEDGTQLYAAANNGLHVIDTGKRQIASSLSTVSHAAGLALSKSAPRGFLTNLFSPQLVVIDTSVPTLLDPIQLLGGPTRPAYGRVATSADGATAYVLDSAGQQLMVVDVEQASPTAFQLGMRPRDIALSPDGRWAYICGCKNFCTPGSVQPFDTTQSIFAEEFEVGPSPYRIAFSPDGKTLYTANLGDGSVSIVDTASRALTATIQVDPQLTDLTISRDGRWLYAISRAAGQLVAIDVSAQAVRGSMNIGPEPREVVLSPDGKQAYVSTQNSVVIVDTATLDAAPTTN